MLRVALAAAGLFVPSALLPAPAGAAARYAPLAHAGTAAASPMRPRPVRPRLALRSGASPFKLTRSAAHGIALRRGVARRQGGFSLAAPLSELCTTSCSGPLLYHGTGPEAGVVMHKVKVYLIQWEPPEPSANGQAGTSFEALPSSYLPEIETFIKDVAAASGTLGNVFSVDTLYGESGAPGAYSSEFGGAFIDKDPYPERELSTCPVATAEEPYLPPENQPCISDGEGPSGEPDYQLIEEVAKFAIAHPSLSTELGALYVMLAPHDVNSCSGFEGGVAVCNTDYYCAYHSALVFRHSNEEHLVVYANMPYDDVPGCETPDQPHGSPADPEIDTLSHEDNESVTDPLGNAWFDIGGNEVADKCTYPFFDPLIDFDPAADDYGPLLGGTPAEFTEVGGEPVLKKLGTAYNQAIDGRHYLTQREWSNAAGGCVTQAPVPVAAFSTYSSPATVGHAISFNGAGSAPMAGALIDYRWDFGDGESASGQELSEVTHAYRVPGEYTVKLAVTNDSGATAETSHTVTVDEPEPTPPERTTTVTVPGPTTTTTVPGPTTTVTVPSTTTPRSGTMPPCPSSSRPASKGCPATRPPVGTRTRRRACGSRATSRRGHRCPRSKRRSSKRSRH